MTDAVSRVRWRRPRALGQVIPLPAPVLPPPPPIAQQVVRVPAAHRISLAVRLALYLFVFSIPFEMPDRTIPIEIPTLTGLVFVLASLLNLRSVYRRLPGAVLWFGAYLWFFGLSTLVNRGDHGTQVLNLFISFVQLVLLAWAGSNVMRDRRAMRGALIVFAVACFLRAAMQVLGIGTSYHAEWTGGYRATVLGQNPNYSAIILSAGLVAVLNLRVRLIAWLMAGVIGVALIQTGSRAGVMCAAVGSLALLWHGRTIWARLRGVVLGFIVLTLLAFAAFRSPMLSARFKEVVTQHSLAGRERIYPAVVSMIGEQPLLGWGPVENQYEIAQRIGEAKLDKRDAHNLVLELLSATGLLGAVTFLIGLALCLREAWRARHSPWGMVPFALVVSVLTGCISGTWIASKVLWFVLGVALAAGAYVDRRLEACAE